MRYSEDLPVIVDAIASAGRLRGLRHRHWAAVAELAAADSRLRRQLSTAAIQRRADTLGLHLLEVDGVTVGGVPGLACSVCQRWAPWDKIHDLLVFLKSHTSCCRVLDNLASDT